MQQVIFFLLLFRRNKAWIVRLAGEQLFKSFAFSFKNFTFFIAPIVSKFFPFRVDPFQKGIGVQENQQKVTQFASLVNMAEM